MAWISGERWAALAGLAFIVLYVAAFALGIEVGASDQEILDYYGDSGNRAKEVVAFFFIAGAALAFVLFASGLRSLIARAEQEPGTLAALAWAGGVACAVLILAGNAVSRATAFAAMSDEFQLDPNTRRVVEDVGFLLFVSAALAAILLVVAVSLAVLRYGVFPRWLGWGGLSCSCAPDARDRVRRLPRLHRLGAHRQRNARSPSCPRDGTNSCDPSLIGDLDQSRRALSQERAQRFDIVVVASG